MELYGCWWLLMVVVGASLSHTIECLVMTGGGTSKVILGYSIPVDLPMPMGINYVHNFQFQYPTVDNASQVSYVQQGARANKLSGTITRTQIYSVIEHMLERNGLDKTCLLRSICESAASPITHSGLIGELLQTLFKPHNCQDGSHYSAAWIEGYEGQDCLSLYPLCLHGQTILDRVSYYI